jgi:hypothetical protein
MNFTNNTNSEHIDEPKADKLLSKQRHSSSIQEQATTEAIINSDATGTCLSSAHRTRHKQRGLWPLFVDSPAVCATVLLSYNDRYITLSNYHPVNFPVHPLLQTTQWETWLWIPSNPIGQWTTQGALDPHRLKAALISRSWSLARQKVL